MAEEFTIIELAKGYCEEKKSQFHSFLLPTKEKANIYDFAQALRKEHPEMCHFCMAARYRNPILSEMSFDDGEPNGTAGRPILNVLQMKSLINVGCVVMRKFGGTLLGKGGLTKAYLDAALDAVKNAVIGKMVTQKILEGKFTYPQWSRVEKIALRHDSKLIAQFLEDVKVTMAVAPDEVMVLGNGINQLLNGFNPFEEIGEKQVFVRV